MPADSLFRLRLITIQLKRFRFKNKEIKNINESGKYGDLEIRADSNHSCNIIVYQYQALLSVFRIRVDPYLNRRLDPDPYSI